KSIGLQRHLHVVSISVQAGPVHVRIRRFRLQQVIANVGAGQVQVRSNLIQQPVSVEKVGPDPVVSALNGSEHTNRINTGEGHQQQQSSKTRRQQQTGISQQ